MRLILVDDDEEFAQNLKKLLEMKGFAVDWLPSATKAYSRILLYQKDYDLIVLDLTMGGMSGEELTRRLRKDAVTTPIVILTGDGDTEHKIALLNAGADEYVVKPFSADELIARINSVLRRPTVAQPVIFAAGNLRVDTAKRKIFVEDTEVVLTLKEYGLLECFVRHPNVVISREDLSNKVWDFASLTLSNVLDVHIKNLRKKLHEIDESVRIETVRGIGYRLSI